MKKTPYKSTQLICLECGYIATINRYESRQKKIGHIKDMFCPCCLKEVKFYEIKDVDEFKWEYENQDNLTELETHVINLIKKRDENNEQEKFGIHKKILTRK